MATITYSVGENDDIYLNVYEGQEQIVSEPAVFPFTNASTDDLVQCLSLYKEYINNKAEELMVASVSDNLNLITMELCRSVYKHSDLLNVLIEREDYNP
jgi:hypothetical protein